MAYGFQPFASFGSAGARAARQRQRPISPEEERSLLGELGAGALSGLAWVGEVLDKPGAALRGVASGLTDIVQGERPDWGGGALNLAPDWLTGITPDQKITGREMLENWGMQRNRPGFDIRDVAGFGAEVLMDPLTYMTFGASALGKGGQLAKRAGLLAKGSRVPGAGKRLGRLTTTLDDLVGKGSPSAVKAIEDAAKGMGLSAADVSRLGSKPIGGMVGLGLPFRAPMGVVGTGKTARRIAGKMDVLGEYARYSRPGRVMAEHFIPGVKGMATEAFQKVVPEKVYQAADIAGEVAVKQQVQKWASTFHKAQQAGLLDPGNDVYMRRLMEGFEKSPNAEVQGVLDEIWTAMEEIGPDYVERGIKFSPLVDDFIKHYTPRGKSRVLEGRGGARRGRSILSVMDSSQLKRLPELHDLPGGTGDFMELSSDPAIIKLLREGASVDEMEAAVGTWKSSKGTGIPDTYKTFKRDKDNSRILLNVAGDPITVTQKGRWKKLAELLGNEPTEVLKSGYFGNSPLFDIRARMQHARQSTASADAISEVFADALVPGPRIKGQVRLVQPAAMREHTVRLGDALDEIGLKANAEGPGALEQIAKRMRALGHDPGPLQALADYKIPKDLFDDAKRLHQGFRDPQAMKPILAVVDAFTNLFKGLVTSPWLAFHGRNFGSGQYRNGIGGIFSLGSVVDARQMLRGKIVRDAHEIPEVARILKDRGIAGNARNGTTILHEMVNAYDLHGRFAGEVAQRTGGTAMLPGSAFEDVLGMRPGQEGFGWGRTALDYIGATKGGSWNPLRMRGVGKEVRSQFGPAKAGENIGAYVEGLNRISPFIQQLRRGVDPAEAAQKVLAAQVSYAAKAFTRTESAVMKRLFPFYSFSSRQIPWVLGNLIEHPGGKMAQWIRAGRIGKGGEAFLPDYVSQTASIPLPDWMKGPSGDSRYLTGFGLMHEDPMEWAGQSPGAELMSRMNPLLKGPLEYITGQSFFQRGPTGGRPLRDMDPTLGRIAANVTGRKKAYRPPQWIETLSGNLPTTRAVSTVRTLTDKRKTWKATALNLLTGMRLMDVSEPAMESQVRQYLDASMRDLGAKDFKKTYFRKDDLAAMPPDERAAADKWNALHRLWAERAKRRAKAKR